MKDQQLPDGTWVTSAIYVSMDGTQTPQCAECDWQDYDKPGEGDGLKIQAQRCKKCNWMRVRYIDNPHPEV